MKDRTRALQLAAEFNRKGDPTGWFERLYQEGVAGKSAIPWANLCPNPRLLDFWNAHPPPTAGKAALTIGCGMDDDAEQLASWGFHTTAFDISETAIRACRNRFPRSRGARRPPLSRPLLFHNLSIFSRNATRSVANPPTA